MPEIKTFRADSMQEALRLVRRELGPDALILHTRQVTKKGRLPWQKEKTETEIVAAKDEQAVQVSGSLKSSNRPANSRAQTTRGQAYAEPSAASAASQTENTSAAPSRRAAPPQLTKNPARWEAPVPAQETQSSHRIINRSEHHAEFSTISETPTLAEFPRTNSRQTAFVSPAEKHLQASVNPAPAVQPQNIEQLQHRSQNIEPRHLETERLELLMNERLDQLQKMVEQLSKQIQSGTGLNLPQELQNIYNRLVESEVEEELARDLVQRLKYRCQPEEYTQPEKIRLRLISMLEAAVNCSGPIRIQPGKQKIVALVGPTGVGKTTTLAKLAANFRLRDHVRMGLITVDTYRIAAVEQLRTYAEIIDLPMRVVTTPEEMKRATNELSHLDLILIDTAGRSPQDDLQINELKTFLGEIVVDETHLVLSATSSFRQLKKNVEKFRAVHPSSVILTKLDEASGAGCILNVTNQLGLPVSYLSMGQNVPRDIEFAEVNRASRLILGEIKIGL